MSGLQKCLIANRGEIAVRIIHACKELGIKTVAVYSEADANALHVELADEAYLIGAPPSSQSYLQINKLVQVALASGCDCVHPGYGFLSESSLFAQAVLDAGLVWVGPPPEAIQRMGSKTEARTLMQQAGVPVVPGFQAQNADIQVFAEVADDIGFPIMIKAAGGGGGKGIRIVYDADELPDAIQSAQNEALKAFGDDSIFLERFIESGKHIEIQVLADQYGNTVHVFERECSVQRRHQKIIEESPSPSIDETTRQQMGEAAVAAAMAVGYVNVGTVEFILTPGGAFYFLEMNTRLQVEHPVTEMVVGLDLVKLQFAIASGEPLSFQQDDLSQQGHAIECRIYAENPHNQFLPEIGTVHLFQTPNRPGVRLDTGIRSGDEISLHYDPMIAKIIVHDADREATIQKMIQTLQDTIILGTTTNIDFVRDLLGHPAFVAGEIDTGFVDRNLSELIPSQRDISDVALLGAAIADYFGQAQSKRVVSDVSDGDVYTPWSIGDHFRLGV